MMIKFSNKKIKKNENNILTSSHSHYRNFRKVLYTGQHMQLVLMTLTPGEEIGEETHLKAINSFGLKVEPENV